ncbi:hypothetical protein TNCT_418021 [Trichonephila clavata]|uniref:Uncharacterized protein n=1 Tax=Trichonephila clavata TaxID=2740835 RepID=A0A8X6IUA8_TRICU|nr:hypothetical protein TNCT_418021 [Trichonephila clavata]
MLRNVKNDLKTVLAEMGETLDPGMNFLDLKQKLMQRGTYLEVEEFIKDILVTTVEDRKKKEASRKKEEEYRKKKEKKERRREQKESRRTPFRKRTRTGVSENSRDSRHRKYKS